MAEYAELDRLLSRYLDGSLSQEELARLESQLAADQQFADHFARWCLVHRQIFELETESKLHDLMDQFVQGSPTLPKETFRQAAGSPARSPSMAAARTSRRRERADRPAWLGARFPAAPAVAMAALVVLLVGAAIWNWQFRARDGGDRSAVQVASTEESAVAAPAAPKIVATLTQVVDCVWAEGAPVLHHGQQLAKGSHVALESGMVKVTFDCGAEVVLQGPCDFVVRDEMKGVLYSGTITANVPRRAFSFAILSPQVVFVDLGTSFGLSVGMDERTELHVFEGEVLCSQPSQEVGGRNSVLHVTANRAVEFNPPAGLASDIAMNEAQFSRLIALRRAAAVEAGHLTEDQLALWLAADVAVTTDAQQRVISWQDIVYGDNHSGEDAIQVDENARPLLVKDAVSGRPAIRFDGESDFLLTTPLETTDDQTVLFVCQFSQSAYGKDRRWGGQIINYDGPDRVPVDVTSDQDLAERTRFLSNTIVPGVLQIGEPLLEEEFQPTLLTGQVFAGFIDTAVVESGRIDAAPVGAGQPVVVSYRYDYEYEHGRSELRVNGRSYGEARAFAPQGITSRKIIGRHAWKELYFHGDLAELLIFNKALSPEELAETTAYLADKYAIQLGPLVPSQAESNP